jgi:hypothetical protein
MAYYAQNTSTCAEPYMMLMNDDRRSNGKMPFKMGPIKMSS